MMKITKNPLFRICGIVAILYYGLFQSNSENALNKRLSPDKIKSNMSEISQKSIYIIDNVQKAKNLRNSNDIKSDKDKNIDEAEDEKR